MEIVMNPQEATLVEVYGMSRQMVKKDNYDCQSSESFKQN